MGRKMISSHGMHRFAQADAEVDLAELRDRPGWGGYSRMSDVRNTADALPERYDLKIPKKPRIAAAAVFARFAMSTNKPKIRKNISIDCTV
jgi:hypothetical protein